jgi:transposase-like protein
MASSNSYGIKYEKAVECLSKDREPLLAFYDFPAEHWKHLRTTDEIDKSFLLRDLLRMRSTSLFSCAICYSAEARVTAWQRAGPEDAKPAAQPSSSLLIGGTRAPL